jgi:hypothetical protein
VSIRATSQGQLAPDVSASLDRRRNDRVHERVRAWVKPNAGQSFRRAHSRDLSSTGLRLVLPFGLERGTGLTVSLKLDGREPVTYLASVAWSKPSPSGTSCETGLALEAAIVSSDHNRFQRWVAIKKLLSSK